eukprot:SAG11_NODE_12927_length_678_cov_2.734024_1_plen_27_part_10
MTRAQELGHTGSKAGKRYKGKHANKVI